MYELKKIFKQEKKSILYLMFNLGWTLTGFRTTPPRKSNSGRTILYNSEDKITEPITTDRASK